MPFELGLFLGAKHFGDDGQRRKRALVLDVERYRYQQFISDLAGVDPKAHGGDPDQLLAALRLFLRTGSERQLIGLSELCELYRAWIEDLDSAALNLGYTPDTIPFADLVHNLGYWLLLH